MAIRSGLAFQRGGIPFFLEEADLHSTAVSSIYPITLQSRHIIHRGYEPVNPRPMINTARTTPLIIRFFM
jgi:hypothetical protein